MGTGAVVVLLLLLLLGDLTASLWCYECGTQVTGKSDCGEFAHASTWSPFWRECPKDSVCVKILPAWPSEQKEMETVRSCTPRANHMGVVHQEGCWSHPTASSSLTCFCANNFCNAALVITPPPILPAILVAIFVLLVR